MYIYIYIILSKAEISLLSKSLKSIPTPTSVNKALIKEGHECFVVWQKTVSFMALLE